MANNRMYVVCDVCEDGEFTTALYIGKRLGLGYYTTRNAAGQTQWQEFYDKHELCGGTLDHFSIRYECGRD